MEVGYLYKVNHCYCPARTPYILVCLIFLSLHLLCHGGRLTLQSKPLLLPCRDTIHIVYLYIFFVKEAGCLYKVNHCYCSVRTPYILFCLLFLSLQLLCQGGRLPLQGKSLLLLCRDTIHIVYLYIFFVMEVGCLYKVNHCYCPVGTPYILFCLLFLSMEVAASTR